MSKVMPFPPKVAYDYYLYMWDRSGCKGVFSISHCVQCRCSNEPLYELLEFDYFDELLVISE